MGSVILHGFVQMHISLCKFFCWLHTPIPWFRIYPWWSCSSMIQARHSEVCCWMNVPLCSHQLCCWRMSVLFQRLCCHSCSSSGHACVWMEGPLGCRLRMSSWLERMHILDINRDWSCSLSGHTKWFLWVFYGSRAGRSPSCHTASFLQTDECGMVSHFG